MIEALLLAVTKIDTFVGNRGLTSATGFFYETDDGQLFLISNRHVFVDEKANHHPDRITIELHTSEDDIAKVVGYSIPLYRNGTSIWRQASDTAGTIDVVAIRLDRAALPKPLVYHPFTPGHLIDNLDTVELGMPLLIVGFPLGFHDTLHHLPVARQAVVASAFGLRFQGKGYFLTDGRMHRGGSGSPVVVRLSREPGRGKLSWILLGVHASRLDVGRDKQQDEALGLNCAWYTDVLETLTRMPSAPGK